MCANTLIILHEGSDDVRALIILEINIWICSVLPDH